MSGRMPGSHPMACMVSLVGMLAGSAGIMAEPERPLVGAIRWDPWTDWGHYQKFLAPKQWRYRLPFYAKVISDEHVELRADTRDVMDQEIAYAKAAGLDYWAFTWYHTEAWPPYSAHMTRSLNLYLSSAHKSDINYCLILLGGVHLGLKEKWAETVDGLVQRFKDRNYQKVLGDRPLLYMFSIDEGITHFGSEAELRAALDLLRQKAVEAGAGRPYTAAMIFNPRPSAKMTAALGFDALSAYSNPPHELTSRELPYSDLVSRNRWFWEECRQLGVKLIPTVNTGWDFRPEADPAISYRNPKADWNAQAKPEEIARHLKGALEWMKEHRATCEANALILYAWNEFNEGGWLTPTLDEGTARIDALGKVLTTAGP